MQGTDTGEPRAAEPGPRRWRAEPDRQAVGMPGGEHPAPEDLRDFMAGQLRHERVREVVRHLLKGCPRCVEETSRLWRFGDLLP